MFCQDIVLVIPVSAIVHIANEQSVVKVAFLYFLKFFLWGGGFSFVFPLSLPPSYLCHALACSCTHCAQ